MSKDVITKFRAKHGDRYDYSKVEYVTAKTKVVVICAEHGEFMVTPNNHLSGYGCAKCAGKGFSFSERLENFIRQAKAVHGDRYDYSLVDFSKGKIKIGCPDHGYFLQNHVNHTTGKNGCPKCSKERDTINRRREGFSNFIQKANEVHGNKYLYDSITEYKGSHVKVSILCPEHGEFQVTPANHWSNGIGCPTCSFSNPTKGEVIVANWLTEHNIKFVPQKTFKDLYITHKHCKLRYDFFLTEKNILIEYDGEHHFTPISFSKKKDKHEEFALVQMRDQAKTEYAANNDIPLIRIRYDDDVTEILSRNIV